MSGEECPPRRKIRRPRTRRRLQQERLAALAGMTFLERPEDLSSVLQRIVEVTERYLPSDGGSSIFLMDPEARQILVATTVPSGILEQMHLEETSVEILIRQKPYSVPDVRSSKDPAHRSLPKYGIRGFVGYPLMWQKEPLGVLYALFRNPRRLPQEDRDFLQILVRRAANTVALTRITRNSRNSPFWTISPAF